MLKKQRAIKIAKKIANKLIEIKEVKAVGIYGSYAKGYADRFTDDVDLVAFCEKIPDKSERENRLKEIDLKKIRDPDINFVDVFTSEKVEITIFYKVVKEAEKWIDSFKKWGGFTNEINIFIENAASLVDPENIIKKLKDGAFYTDEMRKKSFEQYFFGLSRTKPLLESSLKRNNIIFINQKLDDSLRSYYILLYALNKKYFSDTKWIHKDLERFKLKPKNCFERLEEFSTLSCRKKEIKRKLKILKSLAEETGILAKKCGIDTTKGMKELDKW